MAKQQRTATRPKPRRKVATKKPPKPRPLSRRKKTQKSLAAKGLARTQRGRRVQPAPEPDQSSHFDALAVYERGVIALQRRKFAEASTLLRAVIDSYPDEKELHERARVYLSVCERQAMPRDATPTTAEERLYAATLAINSGEYERGAETLRALAAEMPDHDHVQYMLAVVRALRGESEPALAHLQRAIELNPENRVLARQDADLEPLRRDPQCRRLLDRSTARRERRPTHRPKQPH